MNDSHQEIPHLRNNPYKVAIASMVGTAIEFYDYYIYAAAAVLVFNTQFFDKSDEHVAVLLSLSTLALAFLAHPGGQHARSTSGGSSVMEGVDVPAPASSSVPTLPGEQPAAAPAQQGNAVPEGPAGVAEKSAEGAQAPAGKQQ